MRQLPITTILSYNTPTSVYMRKLRLFISVILLPLSGMTVKPWSGIGVVFSRIHYPEMPGNPIDLDIYLGLVRLVCGLFTPSAQFLSQFYIPPQVAR